MRVDVQKWHVQNFRSMYAGVLRYRPINTHLAVNIYRKMKLEGYQVLEDFVDS
jgi:hypothetical protein